MARPAVQCVTADRAHALRITRFTSAGCSAQLPEAGFEKGEFQFSDTDLNLNFFETRSVPLHMAPNRHAPIARISAQGLNADRAYAAHGTRITSAGFSGQVAEVIFGKKQVQFYEKKSNFKFHEFGPAHLHTKPHRQASMARLAM